MVVAFVWVGRTIAYNRLFGCLKSLDQWITCFLLKEVFCSKWFFYWVEKNMVTSWRTLWRCFKMFLSIGIVNSCINDTYIGLIPKKIYTWRVVDFTPSVGYLQKVWMIDISSLTVRLLFMEERFSVLFSEPTRWLRIGGR